MSFECGMYTPFSVVLCLKTVFLSPPEVMRIKLLSICLCICIDRVSCRKRASHAPQPALCWFGSVPLWTGFALYGIFGLALWCLLSYLPHIKGLTRGHRVGSPSFADSALVFIAHRVQLTLSLVDLHQIHVHTLATFGHQKQENGLHRIRTHDLTLFGVSKLPTTLQYRGDRHIIWKTICKHKLSGSCAGWIISFWIASKRAGNVLLGVRLRQAH